MEPIRWNNRFSVGVPSMDAQHARMLDLINSLRDTTDAEATAKVIAGMFDYAATHFRDEEHLLALVGYSELDQQKQEHRAFLDKAAEFASKALASEESREDVAVYLHTWMLHHILQLDMKYAPCIPASLTCADLNR